MSKYRISVSIDEKNFFWIVVDNGKFIRNPTKEDRIGTKIKCYNKTNICDRCRRDNKIIDKSILYPGNARKEYDSNKKETGKWLCDKCRSNRDIITTNTCDRCGINFEDTTGNRRREKDNNGNWTGKWDCRNCYEKYDPNSYLNIKKSLADCRTGNQNPNSDNAKGDNTLELACILYGWENLNEKYDNYTTPIDCYDPKTGLYHQVQGRNYNSIEMHWLFGSFKNEKKKKYKSMVCFCFSNNGKIVERIYEFPKEEIDSMIGVKIVKNPSRGVQWYEKYRKMNEEELKRANEIRKKF